MRKKIAVWKGRIAKGVYPKCILCGEPITKVKELTTEHLRPLSRQGSNEDWNLYCAHARCNFEKGNMTLSEYVAYLRQKERG